MSASEEAATALERAIAALRAGQLPTSIPEFNPQPFTPQAPPAPEPAPSYAAPEPEPQPEAQTFAAPEPEPEPFSESEPGAELVLTDFEAEARIEETSQIDVSSEPEAAPEWRSETPSWAIRAESSSEPERASALSNGHGAEALEASHKTLEDSVKDMLRPMLQRWLDENMTRVLTAALQDELRDNPRRFERD
jgi:cell pole-organizing protein PopZ